jgi:hypothetical protein
MYVHTHYVCTYTLCMYIHIMYVHTHYVFTYKFERPRPGVAVYICNGSSVSACHRGDYVGMGREIESRQSIGWQLFKS